MRALLLSLLVLALLFGLGYFILDRAEPKGTPGAAGPAAAVVETEEEPERTDLVAPVNVARETTEVEPLPEDAVAVVDPTAGNSLSGFVFGSDKQPLANAEVRISADPFMDEDLSMAWFLGKEPTGKSESTRTDATGRYTFKSLAARPDYFLMADHEDYRPRQESGVFVGESGDFAGPDFYMLPGATLSGYVTDVGGNPVPGAKLFLDSAYMMGENQVSPDRMSATSNDSGFFEFRHVPPGPRNLTCLAEGYGNQVVHNIQFEHDDPQQHEERTLTLEVGAPIAGRVFGPDNEPVVGAQIMAMKYSNQVSSRGDAVTDENGMFMIPDLAQGSYNLSVNHKAYRVARHNRVQVGDMNVQVEMIKQACVSGRVVDASGQPVTDFTAVVLRSAPTSDDPRQAPIYENTEIKEEVAAAPDGSYTLCGLSPGTFVIKIKAKGLAPSLSQAFTVTDGQEPPQITVNLTRGGSIKGRVVDATGAGVAGARLATLDDEHGDSNLDPFLGGLVDTSTTQRKGKSDAEGYFEIDLLNPGRYRLKVEHGQHTTEMLRGVVVSEGAAADVGSVTLTSGGIVQGTLYDGSGAAVPRGFVRLMRADHDETFTYQVRTDAQGNYAIAHVKPGAYKLSATRGNDADPFEGLLDQQSSEVVVNVTDGTTVTRELRLGN